MIKFRHNSTYKRKIITLPTGFKNLHLDHKDRCILEAVDTFTPESELRLQVKRFKIQIQNYGKHTRFSVSIYVSVISTKLLLEAFD